MIKVEADVFIHTPVTVELDMDEEEFEDLEPEQQEKLVKSKIDQKSIAAEAKITEVTIFRTL